MGRISKRKTRRGSKRGQIIRKKKNLNFSHRSTARHKHLLERTKENMRKYRERIKANQKKYEELKCKDRERKSLGKASGKLKVLGNLPQREQRQIRKARREYMKDYRRKKREQNKTAGITHAFFFHSH